MGGNKDSGTLLPLFGGAVLVGWGAASMPQGVHAHGHPGVFPGWAALPGEPGSLPPEAAVWEPQQQVGAELARASGRAPTEARLLRDLLPSGPFSELWACNG